MQGVKPTGDRATTIFDLRPDRKHVAVYVHLPDAQIHIRYGRDQLAVLHDALIQITALMH